ncbi:MAG TPA: DUF5677 domain-containing protein [bacterium]
MYNRVDHPLLKKLIEKASGDINKIKVNDADEKFSFKIILVIFLFKAISICQSIMAILQSDPTLYHEAGILTRSLLELFINAKYIGKIPKELSERFLRYNDVWRYRFREELSRRNPKFGKKLKNGDLARSVNLDDEYKQFITIYGKDKLNNWAGKTLKEMANEVNEDWLYSVVYKIHCKYVHPDIDTLTRYMHVDNYKITIYRKSNPEEENRVLATCFGLFAQLYLLCDKEFILGNEDWIENLGKRLTTIEDENIIGSLIKQNECPYCHEHTVKNLRQSDTITIDTENKPEIIPLMKFACENIDCPQCFYVQKNLYDKIVSQNINS